MKGGIYTDQHCAVCGGVLRDTGKDLSCPIHPYATASRFRIKFGKVRHGTEVYHGKRAFIQLDSQ